MKYLFDVFEKIKHSRYLIGCSAEDIENIIQEKTLLPAAYIEFLKIMGKKVDFLDGLSYSVEDLKEIEDSAEILLSRNNPKLQLTSKDFVFMMNQGYLFFLFRIDEGDNPPVYAFAEGVNQTKIKKISDSFSEFLNRLLANDPNLFRPLMEDKD
jgi:hypothetical protein